MLGVSGFNPQRVVSGLGFRGLGFRALGLQTPSPKIGFRGSGIRVS